MHEILNRLEEPLRDLSISRATVKWGIPLPFDKDLTIFVWLEALTNYLSTANYPTEKFKSLWPPTILIGPDIIWHHSVIFSAILLSLGITLPKIIVHGFITTKGEKLSKSRGLIIDPIQLVGKYGSDAVRYYLLRNISFGEDGDFSEEALVNRLNGDLADNLGNLVNRVLVLVEKNFDNKIPKACKTDLKDNKLADLLDKTPEKVSIDFDNYHFNFALEAIFHLVSESNKYINDTEPWKIKDKERLSNVLYLLLESLRYTAILLYPFIPETSEKIFEQLNLEKEFSLKDLKWGILKEGHKIKRGKILFEKVR